MQELQNSAQHCALGNCTVSQHGKIRPTDALNLTRSAAGLTPGLRAVMTSAVVPSELPTDQKVSLALIV